MNINENDIVTLDNNEKYEVIKKLSNNILLLTKKDKVELLLVKVGNDNGRTYFSNLKKDEYYNAITELTKMELKWF